MIMPSVGVAPGTTTFRYNPGGELSTGLGVCPPGHYGTRIMLPSGNPVAYVDTKGNLVTDYYNPYASEAKLNGLRGASGLRWDFFALALGLGFAGVLGYALVKRRK